MDKIPENKLSGVDTYSEYTPNAETVEAIDEVRDMIKNGTGELFSGSTADFFAMIGE